MSPSKPSLQPPPASLPGRLPGLFAVLLGLLGVVGCGEGAGPAPAQYLARVGDRFLTQAEVDSALTLAPLLQDTADARQQFVEQWVQNELLYQEARRRGIQDQDQVKRLMEDNLRSVLVSTLLDQLYEENATDPSPEQIRTYYEQDKERLRLREPYLRLRHLATPDADSAALAWRLWQQESGAADAEERWRSLVARFAQHPAEARALSASFYPEARLLSKLPALREALATLAPGQSLYLTTPDSLHHIVHLVARAPTGSIPQLAWVADELRQRIEIENRKQMVARQVERLRAEATARDALEVR